MRLALSGDRKAYRRLLTELRLWLTAYFSNRIHQALIEDFVQDVLMTVHEKRQTFNPDYRFGPWIAAIARHRWIDHMRKNLTYAERNLGESIGEENQDTDLGDVQHAREAGCRHDVQKLLDLIPQTQAEIIRMVKLEEMSVEEVCRRTGRSPSSVKVMVHRGIRRMTTIVEDMGVEINTPQENAQDD